MESEKYSSDIRTEIQFVKARELKVKGMQGRGVKQMQGTRCKQLIQTPDAKSLSRAAKLILYIVYKLLENVHICPLLNMLKYKPLYVLKDEQMSIGGRSAAHQLIHNLKVQRINCYFPICLFWWSDPQWWLQHCQWIFSCFKLSKFWLVFTFNDTMMWHDSHHQNVNTIVIIFETDWSRSRWSLCYFG